VFLHVEVLLAAGIASLETGEAVGLRTVQGDRGWMAVEVTRLVKAKLLSPLAQTVCGTEWDSIQLESHLVRTPPLLFAAPKPPFL
jgi:hypothetical protein